MIKSTCISFLILLSLMFDLRANIADSTRILVTPNPSPEALKLIHYIKEISGKHTLSGQHSVPLLGSLRLPAVEKQTGRYPALFGQDFGFSAPGTWDGINYRQQIVDEAIRRHNEGFIISLMWHAVNPKEDEPVTFKESIQSDLTDKEWEELVTPGTHLYERWKSQVDVIAFFLKQLKYADVPVLWRPYHEMNGGWFWWGKKKGADGYKKLYRMLYDRLVNFHGLNNLIWVFNANEVKPGVDPLEGYYPGDDFVDILAIDVYSQGFDQFNYEHIRKLAGDKPIALGEVGTLPTPEILKAQPEWAWFMAWGDPNEFGNQSDSMNTLFNSEEVITLRELPWVESRDFKIHFPLLK